MQEVSTATSQSEPVRTWFHRERLPKPAHNSGVGTAGAVPLVKRKGPIGTEDDCTRANASAKRLGGGGGGAGLLSVQCGECKAAARRT
eukprot:SAG11_NODE_3578_length_2358_cov_3.440018_2_plen_88_part_00